MNPTIPQYAPTTLKFLGEHFAIYWDGIVALPKDAQLDLD